MPYEEQQFHSLMAERTGVIEFDDGEQAELAERLAAAIAAVDS